MADAPEGRPTLTPEQRARRARLAALTRYHPDSPEVQAEQLHFKVTAAERYIRDLVASAPPLTQAQRDRLALLLRGAPGGEAASDGLAS